MPTKGKALLLDAGFAALPILDELDKNGFETAVCGKKLQDPGHSFADLSFDLNYADKNHVLRLAQELNISALIPGVTDVSYITGSAVAEQLGLPGFDSPEVTDIVFRKDLFRAWANTRGYPIPQAVRQLADAHSLDLPLMVKPSDAYSGLGITRVNNRQQLAAAWQTALSVSPSGEALIENWCEGNLHSHSAFIRDGEIVAEFFVDEFSTVYRWQVNSSCLSTLLSERMKDQVSECMQTLVAELKLADGLLHTQFIADESRFWLIELTRRCPGDLYSQLIEMSTSAPYSLWFTQPFLAQHSTFGDRRPAHNRLIARHTVSVEKTVRFKAFNFGKLPARIVATVPLKKTGESVEPAPNDRAGIVFAEFDDRERLACTTPVLKNYFTLSHDGEAV
ncbi:ATP-grasp domain-containing protein [Pantoea agglomerans]|uniref:ATP-grasp domain-containing protein n=1 Tax=Enterobacter agglomerans TaxID=549 RepID=A0ACC5RQM1_ENTAG|nr:ATP-grasp domain-containing protein [Pantoea agglomerans]MBK4726994.1 ATP-grasp domain-containing protein [Pantoea agglomerans]